MKVYNRNMSVDSDADMSGDECTEQFDELLYHAAKENRLTRGVFQCAHVLETCPEFVSLCVLPTTTSADISVHIQHKLIEAYCWENDIEVVQLDGAQFTQLARLPRSKAGDTAAMVECVLVTQQPVLDNTDDGSMYEQDERYG